MLAQRRTCGPRQASAPPPPHITRHPSQVFLNTDRAGQARPAGAVPRLSPGRGRRSHRRARRERGPGPRPGQQPPPHCVGSRRRGGERGGRAAGTGGVNGQRPPRGGRAGSASQSTAGAFHFPRGVNLPPSAAAALAAPQKQSAVPAVTSFTRCPQGWVVPAHLSPLCRAVVAAAPPLRLPPRKRRGWCVPAAGASRPAPAPPRRVIDVVVCVAGAAGQAGAAARGRRRGAGAGARDVGVRGGGGRRLPAQRAGGPHFLLPGGPRPAAGLGRLLALAGVPLLPGALAAPPPQPPRLARRAPAPRVPHAQVRLVRP